MDNQIRLFSGVLMNPFDAKLEDINIKDIAHALSRIPRFGGHSLHFYSVAQHCLRCAALAPAGKELEYLLHDATEAYLLDIPKPVKNQIPQYKEAEDRLDAIISKKFNLNLNQTDKLELKNTDTSVLNEEFYYLNETRNSHLYYREQMNVDCCFIEHKFLTVFSNFAR